MSYPNKILPESLQWLVTFSAQAIAWTNTDSSSIVPSGTYFNEIKNLNIFIQEKAACDNVVCKMATILFILQCV